METMHLRLVGECVIGPVGEELLHMAASATIIQEAAASLKIISLMLTRMAMFHFMLKIVVIRVH